jgi:hypothetical protein
MRRLGRPNKGSERRPLRVKTIRSRSGWACPDVDGCGEDAFKRLVDAANHVRQKHRNKPEWVARVFKYESSAPDLPGAAGRRGLVGDPLDDEDEEVDEEEGGGVEEEEEEEEEQDAMDLDEFLPTTRGRGRHEREGEQEVERAEEEEEEEEEERNRGGRAVALSVPSSHQLTLDELLRMSNSLQTIIPVFSRSAEIAKELKNVLPTMISNASRLREDLAIHQHAITKLEMIQATLANETTAWALPLLEMTEKNLQEQKLALQSVAIQLRGAEFEQERTTAELAKVQGETATALITFVQTQGWHI